MTIQRRLWHSICLWDSSPTATDASGGGGGGEGGGRGKQ